MSELIMSTNTVVTVPTLKNAALAEQTAKAARIINGTVSSIQRSTLELAAILRKIDDDALYTDDGYKSTSDFADKVLHLRASSVSDLIKTSRRFGDSNGKPTCKGLEGQSAYNLAYLAKYSDDEISAAVSAGELSPSSTQSQIKEWARNHVPTSTDTESPAPAKVIPNYRIAIRFGNTVSNEYPEIPESNINDLVSSNFSNNAFESKDLPSIKCEDGTTIKRRVYILDDGGDMGAPLLVYYKLVKVAKAKAPKAKTLKASDLTREQLVAMLAEMDAKDAK